MPDRSRVLVTVADLRAFGDPDDRESGMVTLWPDFHSDGEAR